MHPNLTPYTSRINAYFQKSGTSMVHYLIYTSRRKTNVSEADIKKILDKAVVNNFQNHITGILVYNSIGFMQLLEGRADTIHTLFRKIKYDARHTNVTLVESGAREARLFPTWGMGHMNFDSPNVNYISNLEKKDMDQFNGIIETAETPVTRAIDFIEALFPEGEQSYASYNY